MTTGTTLGEEIRLNDEILPSQLQQLGKIGRDHDSGGRTRTALTDAEKSCRDQLVTWMRELELDVGIDQIGNIFGSLRTSPDCDSLLRLMIGSDSFQLAEQRLRGHLARLEEQEGMKRASERLVRFEPVTVVHKCF